MRAKLPFFVVTIMVIAASLAESLAFKVPLLLLAGGLCIRAWAVSPARREKRWAGPWLSAAIVASVYIGVNGGPGSTSGRPRALWLVVVFVVTAMLPSVIVVLAESAKAFLEARSALKEAHAARDRFGPPR